MGMWTYRVWVCGPTGYGYVGLGYGYVALQGMDM